MSEEFVSDCSFLASLLLPVLFFSSESESQDRLTSECYSEKSVIS